MEFWIFQMFEFFRTSGWRSNCLKHINEAMRHLSRMPKMYLQRNGRNWAITNMKNIMNRKKKSETVTIRTFWTSWLFSKLLSF